jgi:hypothetical protein
MNKPVVYVIKEQVNGGANAFDYSPAMLYGDIEFVTRSDIPFHPGSSLTSIWAQDVIKFTEKYDPSRDFIVATGQPTAIFAVGYALGLAGKCPRYLIWRREDNRYRVLENPIEIDEILTPYRK